MKKTTSENKPNDEPRITYIGPKVETPPAKVKNPKRVAAGKKLATLQAEKRKLLKKGINRWN